MTKPVPKNFCIMPFTSMVVRADASASVCCYNSSCARTAQGEKMVLYRDSLDEIFHSAFFADLRRAMLAGERHPTCSGCWAQDDAGMLSKRTHENQVFSRWVSKVLDGEAPAQAVDLSLNLGNMCNLKCRICGPTSSSKWAQEYLDLFGEDHIPRENSTIRALSQEESRSLLTNWATRGAFAKRIEEWLPKVERLEFLGGEPFLNQKQFQLVKLSAETGAAAHQVVTFTTNGSIFPEEHAAKYWPAFKHVCIGMSLDGIGAQFEYQRYGAKWDDVTRHLERYRALDCVYMAHILLTVSIFNVYYLPEIYAYWAERGITVPFDRAPEPPVPLRACLTSPAKLRRWFRERRRLRAMAAAKPASRIFSSYVFQPDRLDIRVLPASLKESVARKFRAHMATADENTRLQLQAVLDHLRSADHSKLWPAALENIWFHDRYRKQSFARTFPEFHAEAVRLGEWRWYEGAAERFAPTSAAYPAVAEVSPAGP